MRPPELLELLVNRLAAESGPLESVIEEWQGEAAQSIASSGPSAPRSRANSVLAELRETWGGTGDPSWLDNLVPGRPSKDDAAEEDFLFALFRRPGVYAYLRLRGDNSEMPFRARLIVGAIQQPEQGEIA